MTIERGGLRVAVVAGSPLVRAGLVDALERHEGIEVAAALSSWRALDGMPVAVAIVDVATTPSASTSTSTSASASTSISTSTSTSTSTSRGDHDGSGDHDEAPHGTLPCVVLLPEYADASVWLARGHAALPSRAAPHAIVAAVHAVAAGLVAAPARWWSARAHTEPIDDPLTPREHDVLERLAQGLNNRAIGRALAISEHTAKFHVAQIIAKLDAASRAHAVAKALRAGLIEG